MSALLAEFDHKSYLPSPYMQIWQCIANGLLNWVMETALFYVTLAESKEEL